MKDCITKYDFQTAYNYIEKIIQENVESIELTDRIPAINDLSDTNKVFKGKLSILFVDMRESTDLTDELKAKKMVKVYRAFIRCIVQAIRYSGGESRQFAGDGIMGVFQDNSETETKCEQQAIKAARYIVTMIDYCLNPLLSKHLNGLSIGCGVGISTGNVMVTKVGMRGKESDETTENEMNIVWTGATTNYASRYCSLANACEIFIDETTYNNSQDDGKWKKDTRIKGNKSFSGFIAREYYLTLPEDLKLEKFTCLEEKKAPSLMQEVFTELKENVRDLVDDISEKSEELTRKINEVNKKEQDLIAKEIALTKRFEEEKNETQLSIVRRRYLDIITIIQRTFCKTELIKQIGKDYWMNLINEVYEAGEIIGKEKDDVTNDLACYLVDIYLDCFPDYEKAYNALCIQAKEWSWLNANVVCDVVKKSKHWALLKSILEEKVSKSSDHSKALQVLKGMGY